MVLAKKTHVTGIWQLSHYTENQKNSKKSPKIPKKLRKFPKKLTLPGFDSYKIPQKCTKIEPGYTIHYYYICPQVCCIIQELQVLLLSSIIHSSNIFKVIIKVFVGHREGIYGEGLQSVQALVKSFALNIPNWVVFTEWLNTHPIFCAKFCYTKQNDLHVSSPLWRP